MVSCNFLVAVAVLVGGVLFAVLCRYLGVLRDSTLAQCTVLLESDVLY